MSILYNWLIDLISTKGYPLSINLSLGSWSKGFIVLIHQDPRNVEIQVVLGGIINYLGTRSLVMLSFISLPP